MENQYCQIYCDDNENILYNQKEVADIIYLDPPFNQKKKYWNHNDDMTPLVYWNWMELVVKDCFNSLKNGGAIYFLHREKHVGNIILALNKAGFNVRSIIIWKKMTSAVPYKYGFNKSYQVLVYAVKGDRPNTMNKLRIDKPAPANYKVKRVNGVYVTDIWDDIRELTSGFYAGDEAIRFQGDKLFTKKGERFHKQQSPNELLLRIILSSSMPNDVVLDPFGGTGTTLNVGLQLKRKVIIIEKNPRNVQCMRERNQLKRMSDDISGKKHYYRFTENIDKIWSGNITPLEVNIQKEIHIPLTNKIAPVPTIKPIKKGLENFF